MPGDLDEAGEVRVSRADGKTMLDRQCSEVRIGDQVAAQVIGRDKRAKDVGVAVSRLRNPRRLRRQPVGHEPHASAGAGDGPTPSGGC